MAIVFIRHKVKPLINITAFYTFHYHEYHSNFVFAGEKHDFWEMVYVDKGTVFFKRDAFPEETAVAGQCFFHKPNEFHRIRASSRASANVFIITFECKSKAMDFFNDKIIDVDSDEKHLMQLLFNQINKNYDLHPLDPNQINIKERKTPVLGDLQLIKNNFETMLISFLTRYNRTQNAETEIVRTVNADAIHNEVIEYLKNNLFAPIYLNDICNALHYQKSALSKRFKEATGKTIFEYLLVLRIDKAKELIRENNFNFTRIAKQLCFRSYSNFFQSFRTITGYTPREYKGILKA